MVKMYLWEVMLGDNIEQFKLVTPDDSMAGALGAALGWGKEHLKEIEEIGEDISPSSIVYKGWVYVAAAES